MLLWRPGQIFWGNPNRFCSITDADKTEGNRKVFFREKVVFYKKFSVTKIALLTNQTKSFWRKVRLFSLNVRRCKMFKKGILKFSEVFFQQNLPMGKEKPVMTTPQEKFRPKARNLWLSLSHWWKNSKFSQTFVSSKCSRGLVKMKFWLPGQVFRDPGWNFFLSSVRKSWKEL